MIEPIMYVAIGFLVACMLIIGIIPVVHARAVRLTTRRLEAVTPMSMAEIQADKDQLRAEFAMSTRRLEMSVDQMKSKTTSQLAEIGKKSEAIGRIKLELGEKTAALFALEAKEKQLSEDLRETQQQRDEKTAALAGGRAPAGRNRARELAQSTASHRERFSAHRRQPARRARDRCARRSRCSRARSRATTRKAASCTSGSPSRTRRRTRPARR